MFKKIAPVESGWFVVDGIVGTGHISRKMEVVDFRPATVNVNQASPRSTMFEVDYRAAKGVDLPFGERISVWYTITDVEYRTNAASAIRGNNPWVQDRIFINGDLPKTAFTTADKWAEIMNFPAPEWKKAEWDAEVERQRAQHKTWQETISPSDKEIVEFAEATTGVERKWIARYARTGKAYDQVQKVMQARWPFFGRNDMDRMRDLITQDNGPQQGIKTLLASR